MSCKKQEYKSGFTLERLEKLEAAIADGVRRVKYTDKEIEYQSLEDMLKARDLMRRKLGLKKRCGEKGVFGGVKSNPVHSKGLDDCE